MIGTGGRRDAAPRRSRALFAILAIAAALTLGASASVAATAEDRAATYAYLKAQYEYQKAIAAAEKGSDAEFGAFATRLEAECRGVLKGAPGLDGVSRSGDLNERQRGEAARARAEESAIDAELIRAEFAPQYRRDAAATAALAAAVAPLRWSDPRIAAAIAVEQARAQEPLMSVGAPEVCADMRAWQQSGYRRLSSRTREAETRARDELASLPSGPSIESLLRPYEGPVERALIRKTLPLETSYLRNTFLPLRKAEKRLSAALGIAEPADHLESKEVVLGKGRTRSGSKFKVTIESPRRSRRSGCRLQVSVIYTRTGVAAEGILFESFSGPDVCLLGKAAKTRPELGCDSGQLRILQVVGPSVTHVRLLLADGRTVTSPVVEIPARRGGPAGLYVQALGRRSSLPVSLTELDAGGAVVAVQPLSHRRCPAPRERESEPVQLAQGTTPAGTSFRIEGSEGLSLGHKAPSVELMLSAGQEFGAEQTTGTYPLEKTFPWSAGRECAPQEWAIVYGVLKSPGASVTAVTTGGEVTLTTAPIPASLHPGGVLAYGVFAQIPSRLIVRNAAGQEIAGESLATRIAQYREYCEGYAEPSV